MHLSGKNEGPTVVIVDESFKSCPCDDGEECDEQVRDHMIANYEASEISMENDGHVKRFVKNERYFKRERCPPGELWKNHILPPHGEEHTNVAFLDDPLNLCEALITNMRTSGRP